MADFELITLSPLGLADPAIPIAGSRAGALGALDLTLTKPADASAALSRLDRFARGATSVRVDASEGAAAEGLVNHLPTSVSTAIVASPAADDAAQVVRALRRHGVSVLVEVCSLAEDQVAQDLDADGFVAKGQESGGRIGDESTFILLQGLLEQTPLPVWAHGGIGLHTAAAVAQAGGAGAVLDAQLLLTRESPVPASVRAAIARMDGSETAVVGRDLGEPWRVYARADNRAYAELRGLAASLPNEQGDGSARSPQDWPQAVRARLGWRSPASDALPIGQDASFAGPLADRAVTVGRIVQAIRRSIDEHLESARRMRPLDRGGPLARSHATEYPIAQGPMTRVSDRAAFAARVAEAGGLPFVALALMDGPEVESLLDETHELLGDRPWGVGILGFVPSDLRESQLEAVMRRPPAFALIAGGRPDQALALERSGVRTYLHAPSPGLLRMFAEQGARRFVLEGLECGGHIGPRSSFVLWETMVETLLDAVPAADLADCHVLFAGGVHDARSSSMVAALAAPLAERGARIGVLMGTAYLFTEEVVASQAATRGFQEAALNCDRTALLETGPGHVTRCAESPFVEVFERERRELLRAGRSGDEIRDELERLNLGRLRIASKGVARNPRYGQDGDVPKLLELEPERQRAEGMYMLGQVAELRDSTCTIAELHHDVSVRGSQRLERAAAAAVREPEQPERPYDVAIVGMACLLPKAPTLRDYWSNILDGVDAVTEVPRDRWDPGVYFDADPSARDKVYSKWGGFLDDVPFDPLRYGMPPSSLPSIEPLQLLTLEAVRAALGDAGYLDRDFPRERTAVVLGVGGGLGDLGHRYALRSGLPMVLDQVPPEVLEGLPEWTEDSFAGILLNVAAGRVANRFDLGGANYTVDAACASSLAAVQLAARELESMSADVVIVGGADTVQNPFGYMCFSKTQALSANGRCRPFDAAADGIAISEGVTVLVLKRRADAERDGDRIYALLKGVAGSSDGRAKGMTAPRPEGQALALERAYAKAGFSPATVGLIEAHGTGTVAGDRAEVETLKSVFGAAGAARQGCAIGSVKSMIGHTKCTAGVAGIAKVALALHHKVLPPTINVDEPNPDAAFAESPFHVNTEARPWIGPMGEHARRAGVSAFGFGGTNFHAVLEEYTDGVAGPGPEGPAHRWPAELFVWSGSTREELVAQLDAVDSALAGGAVPAIGDLAAAVFEAARERTGRTIAIVASSLDDLRAKLGSARERLATPGVDRIADARGVYFSDDPLAVTGKVAFLFPGQGSQSPDMLRDLALHFHEVRERFEEADRTLADRLPERLSSYVFPAPAFSDEEAVAREQALTATDVAQPAIGAASFGAYRLLRALGIEPAIVAGHSYGEYVALASAGVFDEEQLYLLSEARGRAIVEAAGGADLGTMAAVAGSRAQVEERVAGLDDVVIANVNSPRQTVVSGTREGVERAIERLVDAGISARPLKVACAFHSPLVAPARDRLAAVLKGAEFHSPEIDVFSNATAAPYPPDPEATAALLADHLVRPVRFADEVEAMYGAGARVFVEVGPRTVLTDLSRQILDDRPHLAVSIDRAGDSGRVGLLHALAQLAADGVPIDLDRLFAGRVGRRLDLDRLVQETREEPLSPTTWLVNGGRARPPGAPADAPALVARDTAGEPPAALAGAPVEGATGPALPIVDAAIGEPAPAGAIVEFQRLMSRFLETQQDVMLTYLSGTSQTAEPAPQVVPGDGLPQPAQALPAPPAADEQKTASPAEDPMPILLGIVSERTGYPPGMLDADLDLESELGVDSIKRVEIAGAFVSAAFGSAGERQAELMESLAKTRTLREMVECAESLLSGGAAPAVPTPAPVSVPAPEESSGAADGEPPRFVVTAVDADPIDPPDRLSADGVVLITEDRRGVARALADALGQRGLNVALVRSDVFDPTAAGRLVEGVRRDRGRVAGLVHLSLLDEVADEPGTQLPGATEALFNLVRAAAPDLQRAGQEGAGWVVAAACTPAQTGVAGFLKTLALEWPRVTCKAVAVDAAEPAERLADQLVAEIGAGDGEVAVEYREGRRTILRPREASLAEDGQSPIDRASVVLLTGGARGITAQIAIELAERYQPTLVVIGRSPRPTEDEPLETAGLTEPREVKAALIEQLGGAKKGVSPSEVEAAYTKLTKAREIRANLAAMEHAGSRVDYRQVDVRDEPALGQAIADVYDAYGRIDYVVHGAGVIEDALVENKQPDSFRRVIETKALSALALARALRPESLRCLAFFASIAGRFGNIGQSDYAAANEVLAQLARDLDQRWTARVVAIDWGPWLQTGMASAEVQRRFVERGIELVAPAGGRQAFDRELRCGRKREPEVILGGGPWAADAQRTVAAPAPPLPLLNGSRGDHVDGRFAVSQMLDLERDVYLQDHRLDGRPVLPAAFAVELMAEAVGRGWPELEITEIRDFRLLKGVVLEDSAEEVAVVAERRRAPQEEDSGDGELTVDVELTNHDGCRAYRATYVLGRGLPGAPKREAGPLTGLHALPVTVDEAYERWLFHGPLLRAIAEIGGVNDEGMEAVLTSSTPERLVHGADGSHWMIDPVVVDGAAQLAILWARARAGVTTLPVGFRRLRRFGRLGPGPVLCEFRGQGIDSEAPLLTAQIAFFDRDGRTVALVDGAEYAGSRDLNRLAEDGLGARA